MEKCRKEFASYERRNIKYKEDIKYTKKQTKKLATAVEKEEKKAQDALDRYNQAEENLPKLKELVPVLEEEQKKEDAKLEEIYESLKVTAILFFSVAVQARHCNAYFFVVTAVDVCIVAVT